MKQMRRYSDEFRKITTQICNLPELKSKVTKTNIRINHNHYILWNITGEIMES